MTSSVTVSCSVSSSMKTCGGTRSLPWDCNRMASRSINPGAPGWTCCAWTATSLSCRAALTAWDKGGAESRN
jgi:hypothetical protein